MRKASGRRFISLPDECMRWDDIIQVTAASLGVRAEIVHVPTEVIVEKIPFYRGSASSAIKHGI